MWFPYIATILAVVAYAHGYSSGAPPSTCQNMTPGHPASPQKSQSPYVITTSTKEVKAGHSMTVTISGKTANDTIRGLMVQARVGNKIVGTFDVDPKDPLITTMKCTADGDTVTHKSHDYSYDRQTVTLKWNAPADLNDVIVFRATIVLNGAVFWVGIESAPVKVKQ
ncbi:putative defense protein Hdd11-like [Melitaea cinxia]|uniref:putative defense protein Hdd11-like n=1 Tax=Melitaea cinxia TaxID=113334 RepID=UPI001E274547|nr:putative defense protein Hdd11-like [Melitaea cinxia]XP_045458718.1 putative defense protein Hdd11-like [Melitaea cinxia]